MILGLQKKEVGEGKEREGCQSNYGEIYLSVKERVCILKPEPRDAVFSCHPYHCISWLWRVGFLKLDMPPGLAVCIDRIGTSVQIIQRHETEPTTHCCVMMSAFAVWARGAQASGPSCHLCFGNDPAELRLTWAGAAAR